MRLQIEHLTHYVYSAPVSYSIQQLRLTPSNGHGQRVIDWHIKADGALEAYQDAYHNHCHTLIIEDAHDALLLAVHGEVETGVPYTSATSLPPALFLQTTPLTTADAALQQFATSFHSASAIYSVCQASLMQAIHAQIAYRSGVTAVTTPASQVWALGAGVCQDHAHVMLACCRHLGWPARYVSGYLFTEDGRLMQSHAWVEVWDGTHWQGWDVANGMAVNECHVRLACGLDYRSASPVTGSRLGGDVEGMASLVQVKQSASTDALQAPAHPPLTQQLKQQAQAAQQ